MKAIFAGLLVGLLIAPAIAADSDREQLMRIERELADALLAGDATVWDRHVAPTLIFTNPGGKVHDAKQATEGLRSGSLEFTKLAIGEIRVQQYGDTAIVSFDCVQEAKAGDRDYGGNLQWTDTFVRQSGRWILVARHGSVRH